MNVLRLIKQIWSPRPSLFRPPFSRDEPPDFFYLFVMFYTVSFFTQLGVRIEFLGAIRHELLVGVALIGMSAINLMQSPLRFEGERNLLLASWLFVAIHLVHIPFAASGPLALDAFMENIVKHMIFCVIIVALVRSPRHLLGLIGAFVFSMFWVYQEAVRGLISGSLVWRNQGIRRLHGSVPRYAHSNGLSLAACMGLPFCFYLLPATRRYLLVAAFFVAMAVLAGICIVNTGSRAGYVGILALVPYWILDGPGKRKRLVLAVIVGAALLPAIPEEYKGRFASITGEEAAGHSREAREQILFDAWAVFKQYPLGTGIEGFPVVRQQMFGRNQDTHNLYAQAATHLGIQGLVIFVYFVVAMFRSLNRSLGRLGRVRRRLRAALAAPTTALTQDLATYAYEVGLVLAVVRSVKMLLYFMLVNGLFAHTLYHVIWWFLAGITLATGSMTVTMDRRATRAAEFLARDPSPAAESPS